MDWLVKANNELRHLIAWVGKTHVAGVPLDIPAHLLVAAVLYYLLAGKFRPRTCFLVVFGLALAKELYDLSALLHNRDYLEPVKDLAFTGIGIAIGRYLRKPVRARRRQD
jgi:hypothetical protein